jgi:hypothetical protein
MSKSEWGEYKNITEVDSKEFNLYKNGLGYNHNIEILIAFFYKISQSQEVILKYNENEGGTENIKTINSNWRIKINKISIPLPGNSKLLGYISYHKFISIVLISADKKEKFLLFTIGAEGDWKEEKKQGQEKEEYVLKYNVSIPDMKSINCIKDKTSDECKQKWWGKTTTETKIFEIYNKSVNLKIIFILLLMVILADKSAEKVESKIINNTEDCKILIRNKTNIHYFTWDTGYYYGINIMKEIRHKFPSHYRECYKECNIKNYNCWHFADLMYTMFTRDEYQMKIDSERDLETALISWYPLHTLRREQCCIRNLFIKKGITYKEDFIMHLQNALKLANYHKLVNNVGNKQATTESKGGNLKKIKWKKSKKIKRRKNKSKRKPRKINKKTKQIKNKKF